MKIWVKVADDIGVLLMTDLKRFSWKSSSWTVREMNCSSENLAVFPRFFYVVICL